MMGGAIIGKTSITRLTNFNPPKEFNETEEKFDKYSEGTIKMVQESTRHTLQRWLALVMGNINLNRLGKFKYSWRQKVIEAQVLSVWTGEFPAVTGHRAYEIRGTNTPPTPDLSQKYISMGT